MIKRKASAQWNGGLKDGKGTISTASGVLQNTQYSFGTRFEDVLMAQAARHVIITAERIVDGAAFEETPELVAIPGFLVHAVVDVPGGAWPCSCAGYYDYDADYLAAYVAASKDETEFKRFVEERILAPALAGARS